MNAKVESCKDNKLSALSLRGTNKVRDKAIHNVAYFKDSIAESRKDKIIDCHDSTNAESCNDKCQSIETDCKAQNLQSQSKSAESIQPYPNLSYESIPPELAWDLNLPLPRGYGFIFCLLHGAGTTAMTHYLRLCGIALNRHWGNGDYQYMEAYKLLLKSNKISGVIVSSSDFNHTRDKMIKLVDKQCPILSVFRDPISVLKPVINHLYGGYSKKPLTSFALDTDIKSLFDFKLIRRFDKVCISDFLRKCCNETHKESIYYGNEFLIQATQFICIDMKEILPQKAFYTMQKLSKFLGFHIDSCIEDGFKRLINSNEEYDLRPLEGRKMMITIADKVVIIYFSKNEKFEKDFVECIHLFSQSNLIVSQFGLKAYISKDDFALLNNDKDTFVKVKDFLREYFIQAEQYRNENYNRLFDESKILELLRKDKKSSLSLRKALRMRYAYVIKKYPDIVESWKYYQEFERMCEELDK
ncbi:DUF2972 domain-containing protein [Helicobacter rodentium]|uniref:DUF2972 domain-containing protein n=2 Tax=Helicobacter rodentium TaxID=59617 RepID=UPI002557E581|nr:DUF2972 domain-containing protein [Helicobacter rodentium]